MILSFLPELKYLEVIDFLVAVFPWMEMGLRQVEKRGVVHPLFYCHKFYA